MSAVVVGQVALDLVLRVPSVPGPGGTAPVRERRQVLGGKGANQAVALRQLTPALDVALVGVVGADREGEQVLNEARADGIDVRHVRVRAGARTALMVDVTDGAGDRRVLEHAEPPVLLTEADVQSAAAALGDAGWLLLQLQQPAAALLVAARLAPGARVVLDGAPAERVGELLGVAHVLRADATEAELLADRPIDTVEEALVAARSLRRHGPGLVALGVRDTGDVLSWEGGECVLPFTDDPVADPTGGGDSFVAGLVAGLDQGLSPPLAGELARRAASSTVSRIGGRPDLSSSP